MNDYDEDSRDGGSHDELPMVSQDKTLTKAAVAAIDARLNALPTRQNITLANAIRTLAPTVKRLRDRGYSINECAAELTANGLKISGRTLSRLTATAKPKKRAKREQA